MIGSRTGELAALATAFCYTLNGIYFESAGKKVGSLAVNFIRLIIGFIFLSIFTYINRGQFLPLDATAHNWIWLGLSGFVGFFLGDLFLFQAYVEIGTRITLLIMATSPPITALLGFIFMEERISYICIVGMLITLSGIGLVILGKDREDEKIKFKHPIRGIIFAFLGAVGQSVGMILSKVGMGNYSSLAATQIRIVAGFIAFVVLFIYLNKWEDLKKAAKDKKAMVDITLGSLFGPFLGVSLQLTSLKYTAAGISSTITSIMPVTVLPYSIFVEGEKLTIKEVFGTLLSVIGIGILFLI